MSRLSTSALVLISLMLSQAVVAAQDGAASQRPAPDVPSEEPAAGGEAESPAASTSEAPVEASDAEARGLFEAGSAAYSAGRFEDAQGYFSRAHELSGRPGLLFNVGQAAQRAGDDEAAIAAYERYLDEVPDAENRSFVESSLDTLTSRRRDTAGGNGRAGGYAAGEGAEELDSEGGSVLPAVFFTAAGVGLALGIVGSLLSNSAKSEIETECTLVGEQWRCPSEDLEGTYDAIGTWALIADIGFGFAFAGVVAGVLSLVLAGDEDEPSTTASAGCGPTGCRLSLRTRF